MPTYAYVCDTCEKHHEEFRSMSEKAPRTCPYCGAGEPDFHTDYGAANSIFLIKGEPTTFGQQAEINAKIMGKEQMMKMSEKRKFTGRLPKGAKLLESDGSTPPWRDGSFGTKQLDKPLDLKKVSNVKRYIETGETN